MISSLFGVKLIREKMAVFGQNKQRTNSKLPPPDNLGRAVRTMAILGG